MATINKDFRVKHGLYVGSDIDALRGSVSASNYYGNLFTLSANGANGTGTDVISGQETLTITATSGLNATVSNNNIAVNLNVDSDDFSFDGGTLKLNSSGTADFGSITIGGGYGDTGITLTDTGNISANGELVVDGNVTANEFYGDGTGLTSNVIISAGGDVDNVTTTISDLDGTYSLNLELKDTAVTPGAYGSSSAIPTFTVDADGRLTAAGTANIDTDLGIAGDTGTGSVDLLTQNLKVIGTANEIETTASSCSLQIGLPNDVTIGNDLTVTNDLIVTGNLQVDGTTVTANVSAVTIEDPVIKLAEGNNANIVDIGFYGEYNDGTTKYSGLIRDASHASNRDPYVFFNGSTTDILAGNATGSNVPSVSNYADLYIGRLGINTNDYNATTRVKIDLANTENIHLDGEGDLFLDIDRNASGDSGRLRYQTNGTDEFETGFIGGTAGYHITDGSVNPLLTVLTGGNVGINTVTPNEKLTVSGNISADGNINLDGDITFSSSGDILIPDHEGAALEIKEGTNLYQRFVTTNGSEGVEISKQLTLTTVAGTTDSVLIEDAGVVKKRTIDSRAWGSTLVDGSGTLNRLTKWTETGDTVGDSSISDVGGTVTFGVGNSSAIVVDDDSSTALIKYGDTSAYFSKCGSVSQSASAAIVTFPHADYRSAKVIFSSCVNGAQYEVAEMLLVHDTSDTYQTEYGSITTGTGFCVEYTSRINGSNIEVIASNSCSGGSANVTASIIELGNL